jgi:hypothetical protein
MFVRFFTVLPSIHHYGSSGQIVLEQGVGPDSDNGTDWARLQVLVGSVIKVEAR